MTDYLANEALQMFLIVNIVAAIGMHVVYASGQLNLGQAGFFAVGAYTTAYAVNTWGWPLVPLLVASGVAAAIVAVPVAFGAGRVRGIALIMGTLAAGEIIRIVLGKVETLGGGLGYIVRGPGLTVGQAGAVALVVGAAALGLMSSRFGLQIRALFDDEDAAAALGVGVRTVKVAAVVASAGIVGVAGGLFALWIGALQPGLFNLERSFTIALFSLVGGVQSLLGALAGAAVVTLVAGTDSSTWPPFLEFAAQWRKPAFGLLVILLVARRPEGIVDRAWALRLQAPLREIRVRRRRSPPVARRLRSRSGAQPAVLTLRDVGHSYDGVRALEGVSLDVHEGEIVALIGANGAGKTTLIDVVSGAVALQQGQIRLGATDVGALDAASRSRLGVARTFQSVRSFSHLTIEESVWLGGVAAGGISGAAAAHILSLVGLESRHDALASHLTPTELRRLELARALAGAPSFLFLDEPSAGMDESERAELAAAIRAVRATGTAIVIVDHNLDLAFGLAERVVVLDFGRLIATGSPEAVFENSAVRTAYLGETGGEGTAP